MPLLLKQFQLFRLFCRQRIFSAVIRPDLLELTVSNGQDAYLPLRRQQVLNVSKDGFCSLCSDAKLDIDAELTTQKSEVKQIISEFTG